MLNILQSVELKSQSETFREVIALQEQEMQIHLRVTICFASVESSLCRDRVLFLWCWCYTWPQQGGQGLIVT